MEESFDLPVSYKGEEHLFSASLLITGYTYRFNVLVDGQTIIFEPDEESSYRAMIDPNDGIANSKPIDNELLQAIMVKLVSIRD